MSRRRKPEIRVILPDPKYKNLVVTKFMNMVMEDGKKSTAEKIVYGALDQIANKKKTTEPAAVLQAAFDNVAPSVEVKSRRVGGRSSLRPPHDAGHALGDRRCSEARRKIDGGPPRRRAAGRLRASRRRGQEARRHAQDGGSQQGLRALPLVIAAVTEAALV